MAAALRTAVLKAAVLKAAVLKAEYSGDRSCSNLHNPHISPAGRGWIYGERLRISSPRFA